MLFERNSFGNVGLRQGLAAASWSGVPAGSLHRIISVGLALARAPRCRGVVQAPSAATPPFTLPLVCLEQGEAHFHCFHGGPSERGSKQPRHSDRTGFVLRNTSFSGNMHVFICFYKHLLFRWKAQKVNFRRPVLVLSECSQNQMSWSLSPRTMDTYTFTLHQWTIKWEQCTYSSLVAGGMRNMSLKVSQTVFCHLLSLAGPLAWERLSKHNQTRYWTFSGKTLHLKKILLDTKKCSSCFQM